MADEQPKVEQTTEQTVSQETEKTKTRNKRDPSK